MMDLMIKALKEVYDVDDCKYILEGGCVSGCAHSHIYYSQTNSFYDLYWNDEYNLKGDYEALCQEAYNEVGGECYAS